VVSQPIPELPPRHDVPAGGRSGYVLLDDRQVHYLEWGHAGLPAVVCLHGGGQTAYMFEQLGVALTGRFHVLAWDFADHGDSDPFLDEPENPFDRHILAADAAPLCAEFGIRQAVFVGASMGGIVSVTIAASQPDLVGGVVLLDVGHRMEVAGVQRITAFMAEHESFADLDEAAAAIATYLPDRAITKGRLTRNLRQRADGRWVWKHGLGRRLRARGAPVTVEAQEAGFIVPGLDDDLRGLHRPTLVLRGANSDVLSEAGADELLALLPDARFARITGAGHLAAGDNPESFVALVGRFLDEISWADAGLNRL
jgi:pimeloyl-ACP methyl ester carboxylesterase